MSWQSPNEIKLESLVQRLARSLGVHSLLVFGFSKLKMRMLEGLAKHLEHVNEKLFCSILVDRACGRVHPCCFGNETGIGSHPSVAWIADNTAHVLRIPRAFIAAKATNGVGFWYRLLAVVGDDVSKVHCCYRALSLTCSR